jgi:serine/threonine-protein kinase HipA
MFGAFTDCAPDRWGRRLINRDERNRAEARGTRQRSFAEIDYLLGVRDDFRQGALRFRDPEIGAYIADSNEGIPYLVALGPLLAAAEHLERNEATADEVRDLLRAGAAHDRSHTSFFLTAERRSRSSRVSQRALRKSAERRRFCDAA